MASMGSRAIAAAATTPCQRSRAIIASGTSPEKVRSTVFSWTAPKGSPFAAMIGVAFERTLKEDDYLLLRNLYKAAGVVESSAAVACVEYAPPASNEDESADDEQVGVSVDDIEDVRARVRDAASGKAGTVLLVQPPVRIEVGGTSQTVIPDFVLLSNEFIRVGDIKSYLYLDGRTDASATAKAIQQVAVGCVAFQQLLAGIGVPGRLEVVQKADLVYRTLSGSESKAVLRSPDAEGEIRAVASLIADASSLVDDTLAATGGDALDSSDALSSIPKCFSMSCFGSCALAEVCAKEAEDSGELWKVLPGLDEVAALGLGRDAVEALATGRAVGDDNEQRYMAYFLRQGWEK